MYVMLAICLSLAGLLAIHTLASLAAALLWKACARFAERWRPAARARFVFLLRIFPALTAVFAVGAVFLPAYLNHEPYETTEIVTIKLGIPAALSLCAIGYALWRGSATYLVTRRMVRDWLRHSEPVVIDGSGMPAYRFEHAFPVIAVVGALRPRLFIARQVFRALNREEIEAAVAHERGHLAAGDIVKRTLLRLCCDLQTAFRVGRCLDREWLDASELAADEHAASRGASVALNLASALVKVARLAPRGGRAIMPAGAALIEQDLSSISRRVVRLTYLAGQSSEMTGDRRLLPGLASCAGLCSLFIVSLAMIYNTDILAEIHSSMERIVSIFQ